VTVFESNTSNGLGLIHGVFPGQSFDVSFQTPAANYTLDSFAIEFLLYDSPISFPDFHVRILQNGTSIGELTASGLDPATEYPGGTAYLEYTATTPIPLSPNTVYVNEGTNKGDPKVSWLNTPSLCICLAFGTRDLRVASGWTLMGGGIGEGDIPKFTLSAPVRTVLELLDWFAL